MSCAKKGSSDFWIWFMYSLLFALSNFICGCSDQLWPQFTVCCTLLSISYIMCSIVMWLQNQVHFQFSTIWGLKGIAQIPCGLSQIPTFWNELAPISKSEHILRVQISSQNSCDCVIITARSNKVLLKKVICFKLNRISAFVKSSCSTFIYFYLYFFTFSHFFLEMGFYQWHSG